MNYDDMTDFEINSAIADSLGYEYEISLTHHNTGSDSSKHEWKGAIYKKITDNKKHWRAMDYCNDWGVMGPVIQEHGIDIEMPHSALGNIGTVKGYNEKGNLIVNEDFYQKSEALRAAAICFLKMKESEK